MDVEIIYDQDQLDQLRASLADIPEAIPRVVSRGINKTADAAHTRILRAIGDAITLDQEKIRQAILGIDRATYRKWRATMQIAGPRQPLIFFGAKQFGRPDWDIEYQINRAGGAKRIHYDKHKNPVFIAKGRTGREGVFRRMGPRWPIKELYGPSVPAVYMRHPGLSDRVEKEISRDLVENIDAEMVGAFRRRRAI